MEGRESYGIVICSLHGSAVLRAEVRQVGLRQPASARLDLLPDVHPAPLRLPGTDPNTRSRYVTGAGSQFYGLDAILHTPRYMDKPSIPGLAS